MTSTVTNPREKSLDRYVIGSAIEALFQILEGRRGRNDHLDWRAGEAPFADLWVNPGEDDDDGVDVDAVLGLLVTEQWTTLWKDEPDEFFSREDTEHAHAERRAKLLTGRMLMLLAGSSRYCVEYADHLLRKELTTNA